METINYVFEPGIFKCKDFGKGVNFEIGESEGCIVASYQNEK
jgi:hypothetical protein